MFLHKRRADETFVCVPLNGLWIGILLLCFGNLMISFITITGDIFYYHFYSVIFLNFLIKRQPSDIIAIMIQFFFDIHLKEHVDVTIKEINGICIYKSIYT